MTFEPTTKLLTFVLPLSFKKGEVTFVATRSGEDIRMAVQPTNRSRHVVSTAQLTKGLWRAQLNWSDGYTQYLDEKEIAVL